MYFTNEKQLKLYKSLLLPRLIEEKMMILLRQGKISKWFSGIGQEAISVGATEALQKTDFILPLHRNLGVFTSRGVPLDKLFLQWQGKKEGFTKGRDRSFHFGSLEHRIIGMISHLGAMLGVADGLALASNLLKEKNNKLSDLELDGLLKNEGNSISLVFSGDGGASEGDFHEAINTAAVWDLPVIFLIENNGYGLSTPSSEQFRCKQFIDKAIGYGIEGVQVDGNNILEVYSTVSKIASKMRVNRKPVILEAVTFRMRGHEEASGNKYVPRELIIEWEKKDPIKNFENKLFYSGILNESSKIQIRNNIKSKIDEAVYIMLTDLPFISNEQEEINDVYSVKKRKFSIPKNDNLIENEIRFVDAISEGLTESLNQNEKLIVMGQDIAEYGGAFKVTDGLLNTFGKARIRNTPLCESAIIGAGLGLALRGFNSVIEMQFADFVSCGFNQIVNNLAKTHYRWGESVNVTLRMPTGAGVGAGPFHSQSNEAWFTHVAGLKVVYPSTPYNAKGLLISSIEDPNPVLYFEHKHLYRLIKGIVPNGYYTIPIGEARVVQNGNDATIVTYGWGVHWAIEVANQLKDIYSIEVIDLQTLLPLDKQTIYDSIRKTSKCLVLHEDTLTGGYGGEISALISEFCFNFLDAPVMRLCSMDTPVPFNPILEADYLP